LGLPEYYALAAHLDARQPAEVVIVGSSRGREGMVVPELRRACEAALGRPVEVANYSLSGGRADQYEAVVGRLLRHDSKPALLLVALGERDFRQNRADFERLSLFWRFPDWLRAFRQHGRKTLDTLPFVARNEFARLSFTLRYRPQIRHAIRARLSGVPEPVPNPFEGHHTEHHAGVLAALAADPAYQERSLVTRPQKARSIARYIKPQLKKGKYPMDKPLVASLDRLIAACQDAGVPVVLFETPPSDILRKQLPRGTYQNFMNTVRRLARRRGVPWVTVETMGLKLDDSHLRDKAHLNYRGASALTAALAEHAVIPRLTDPAAVLTADRARLRPAATAPSTQPANRAPPSGGTSRPSHQ
jgi:hypothetical protein